MAYRAVKINWLPRSPEDWRMFTSVRAESARLWSWLVERHADVRHQGTKWPSKSELKKEIKRQFPALHSQSAQEVVHDFCEAVASAETLRKKGEPFRYPYNKPRFRQVVFTNQGARIRDGNLLLPCGIAGTLAIRIPDSITLPGRLMEVNLDYGSITIICKVDVPVRSSGPIIGIDLGVNSLIAATDGKTAVVVSGREVKTAVQFRNKRLAEIQSKQAAKTKGSRRHKRLQRQKHRTMEKSKNKVRDLCHKATRKVADTFPNAKAYVGKPFNDACRNTGRVRAQTVSAACNRKIINFLNYKLAACIEVDEAYSSQTCPACGARSKHRRTYRCRCGFEAPRDVVGASNIRAIGIDGQMRVGCDVPDVIHFRHPSKYPGINRVDPRTRGKSLGGG